MHATVCADSWVLGFVCRKNAKPAAPADVSEGVEPLRRGFAGPWRVESVLARLPEQRPCLVDVELLVKLPGRRRESLCRRRSR